MVFDDIAGEVEDEVTLRADRAASARWRLRPRILRSHNQASPNTAVVGHPIAMPVLAAPTAFHRRRVRRSPSGPRGVHD
jgi:4-hydroxymandelate oxidase